MNDDTVSKLNNIKVAVIGLGYVGLPLAIEFGKKRPVIGFDVNSMRIKDLKTGKDETLEVTKKDFFDAKYLSFTDNHEDLSNSNCYIITVPTPIDARSGQI